MSKSVKAQTFNFKPNKIWLQMYKICYKNSNSLIVAFSWNAFINKNFIKIITSFLAWKIWDSYWQSAFFSNCCNRKNCVNFYFFYYLTWFDLVVLTPNIDVLFLWLLVLIKYTLFLSRLLILEVLGLNEVRFFCVFNAKVVQDNPLH